MRTPSRLALIGAGLCLFGALLGVVALVGWITGTPALTTLVPGQPAMQPNTAVAFVALGIGGALGRRTPTPRRARAVAIAAAAVALAIGLLTLAEYAFDVGIDIDQLLFRDLPEPHPGRPSPPTALALTLLALALLCFDCRKEARLRPSEWLIVAAAVIGFTAVLAQIFGTGSIYRIADAPVIGVAVPTACGLVATSVGLLLERPQTRLMRIAAAPGPGGMALRRLGPLAILAPAVFGVLTARLLAAGVGETALAFAVLTAVTTVVSLVLVVITAVRLEAAHAELERVKERARTLVEQAADGIFVADLDGRYVEVNDAACRMLGYSREELLGKRIVDLIPESDAGRLWESRGLLLEGGADVGLWRLRRKDGSYLPAEVSANILPDGRWQASVRDVSERLRAEEEARAMARLIEDVAEAGLAVSAAVAGLPQTSLQAALKTIALQAQSLTQARYVAVGLGSDERVPFNPWVAIGVDDDTVARIGRTPRPVGTLGAVPRHGPIRVADVRRHPDFAGFPPHHPQMASFLGVPIRYRGVNVGNLYLADKMTAEEFTPRDQRLVEMLASRVGAAIETARLYQTEGLQRAWLAAVIDQMPEGIVLFDAAGRVYAVNRALQALTATDAGDGVLELRLPGGAPPPEDQLPIQRALRAEETVLRHEYVLLRPGGDVPVLVSATPIHDGGGQVAGAVMSVQDISVQKQIERLREEWTAVVAHDLRQPITALVMNLGLLARRKHELPDREQVAFERSQTALGRLRRMIDDLLDASRIEAQRLKVRPREVDLSSHLQEVVERWPSGAARLRLVAPTEQHVWADPDRIEQIVCNLLSNAEKYGDPGAEITIEVVPRERQVQVTVSNRGPGISSEDLPRIFGRFARSADAERGPAPGLGLGLYISKGLVEAQGGEMWAESTPKATTRFHFTLPCQEAGPGESAARDVDTRRGPGEQPGAGG